MNVGVTAENQMIGVLVKEIICGILVHVVVSGIKHVNKYFKYLDIKTCPCEKRQIGKLVLECQDEVLNATVDKKVTC